MKRAFQRFARTPSAPSLRSLVTSIAHRIKNPLRRTSEHIANNIFSNLNIIFTAFWLFLNLKEYDIYLSYHTYSYIIYITMHFLNKFSHDNDLILVHRKLGQKLITMEDFINLHNMWTLFHNILFGKMNRM